MTTSDSGERRVPARIDLEDFIEAVTRGVQRAVESQGDTAGFINLPTGTIGGTLNPRPPIIMGLIAWPPGPVTGGPTRTVERAL
jgi:hypothetical protein